MLKKILLSTSLAIIGTAFLPVVDAEAQIDPWIGEIRATAASYCPTGWADANGQLLAICSNQALFSLFGTIYGGDGRTTFGLPDLRGRAATGAGQQPGLRNWTQGSRAGTVSETLISAQVPSHTHRAGIRYSTDPANSTNPKRNAIAGTTANSYQTGAPSAAFMHTDTVLVDPAGSASPTPLTNEQPFLANRYCVALFGIYPSRD